MTKLIDGISIGTDVELFLKSKETGHMIPSFYFLDADKWNPKRIGDDGYALSCDNCSVEYNIPPCKTVEEWVAHNLYMQNYIQETICKPNDLELVILPAVEFQPNDVKSRQALTIGCEAQFNCYSKGKPSKSTKYTNNIRMSGLHIHTGYSNPSHETNMLIIRALDLFVSVPLVIFEPVSLRTGKYGMSGCYREPIYGIEYRTPSNFVASSPELLSWGFNQTQAALNWLNDVHTQLPEIMQGNRLESIINNKDIDACRELVKEFKLNVYSKELILAE